MDNKISGFFGEYRFLSNFYNAPVTYDRITYRNNEAAFQAQKCGDRADRLEFQDMDPAEAKRKGRRVTLRPDWNSIRIVIMTELVMAKFRDNPELAEKLIATGDAYLEESNTWGDKFWGTVNGEGENHLGKILMKTRNHLISQKQKG